MPWSYMRFLLHIASAFLLNCGAISQWQLDGAGWTTVQLLGTTYYVSSSSGNDTFDGRHPEWIGGTQGPKRTIQAGFALLQSSPNFADWLLLKVGDTFQSPNDAIVWNKSGLSTTNPMVLGSYTLG